MAIKTVDSLNFGDTHVFTLPYGECSTAAATVAKTVAVQGNNFSLETGARVLVKFTVTNTASSPTLNVSGTGAKAIYYRNAAISAGYLAANRIYEFVYDGTQWELIGDVNTNTTYSVVSTSANGLAPKRDGSTTKFLRADGTWAVPPDTDTVYTHPSYTSKTSGLYKITVDSTGHVSEATAVAKSDITALGIPSTNTTYSAMTGATSSAAGVAGLVPAPAAGKHASFLRGDGTWVVPTNTTYSAATTSAAGLMSASDKSKLDGIASGANAYTHPTSHPASMITGLATVATSGSYNDLSNKPTIPTGAAASKGVDTSISAASTSTNLPTSKAVAAFVEGKGYKTTDNNYYHTPSATSGIKIATGTGVNDLYVPTGTTSSTVALGNHTHSSYANQNAFSNIKVGSTTIAADTTTDTLELVAGDNITLTPDASGDKVTISASGGGSADAMPKSGGAFTGTVTANSTTSYSGQIRNIHVCESGDNFPAGNEGDILLVFSFAV